MGQPRRISVVLRTAGERTCTASLARFSAISPTPVGVIKASSVRDALSRSLSLHIQQHPEVAINVDADVLPTRNALRLAVDEFLAASPPADVGYFRMLCSLHGGFAFVGTNLYRGSILSHALDAAACLGESLRPDADAISVLRERGFRSVLFNTVLGVHDHEQYLRHVFVKMYNRARRSRSAPYLRQRFAALSEHDVESKAALMGLTMGLEAADRWRLRSTATCRDVTRLLQEAGIRERAPLGEDWTGPTAEDLIASYKPTPQSVSWEATARGVVLSYGQGMGEVVP